jgi:hypothetical protein
MATWQFDFSFVPIDNLSIKIELDENDLVDFSSFWLLRQPPENYKEIITKILLPTKSWNEDILIFGKEDETRINVVLGNSKVVDISARIDLRTIDPKLLSKIVDLANLFNCNLYLAESKKMIENNYIKLIEEISKSNAAKFVKDPREFLDKIGNDKHN